MVRDRRAGKRGQRGDALDMAAWKGGLGGGLGTDKMSAECQS
jgi:hypothetical protein